jgi:hypothetical protein
MAEAISNLLVRIGVDASEFRKGLNGAKAETRTFASQVGSSTRHLVQFGSAAAAAGVALTIALVNKGRNAVDEQAKLAQRLNTTVEAMANLERAGQLTGVSMNTIATAARTLDVNMAKAEQGTAAQADAFAALGVSMDTLRKMPVDQRIATINEALRNNVDASQRAAVAADIFGSRNAQALSLIDTSVLTTAAREAQIFGTALSDIDAAKVEIANDAFSRIQMALDGLAKQLAVRFAPVLQAIGDMFLSAAEDAGGMGTIADRVFKGMVSGVGFVLDAIRGLQVVVKGIQLAFSAVGTVVSQVLTRILDGFIWITESAAKMVRNIIDGANKILEPFGKAIPTTLHDSIIAGTEIASKAMADIRESSLAATQTIGAEMHELMMQQMPSEALKEKIAEYQGITDEAAAFELERRAKHQMDLTEIEEAGADARIETAEREGRTREQILKGAWDALTTLMNSRSRKLFEIGKVAAISQALVSTYQGAAEALKLGWPLGPPAAAAITTAGLAQVQNIKAQSFGGGGKGGGGGSVTQNINAQSEPVRQPERNVFIRGLNPGDLFSGEQVMNLFNQAVEDGARPRFA